MAHYAKLDENNVVTEVIVINNNDCLDGNGDECEENGRRMCEALTGYANWKKTSFNTRKGIYYEPNTDEPSADQSKAYRGNFAVVGMSYDENLDSFIPPKKLDLNRNICESWILENYEWVPPTPEPNVEEGYVALWSETEQRWIVQTLEYWININAKL